MRINDPFEQSFFTLVHLPYLQPFIDVNQRAARLMANIPLLKADLCHLTFVGIPRKTWVEALLTVIDTDMEKYIAPQDQADVRAVVIQAVKELHEGKLVSFKLSRSEFAVWKDAQK